MLQIRLLAFHVLFQSTLNQEEAPAVANDPEFVTELLGLLSAVSPPHLLDSVTASADGRAHVLIGRAHLETVLTLQATAGSHAAWSVRSHSCTHFVDAPQSIPMRSLRPRR